MSELSRLPKTVTAVVAVALSTTALNGCSSNYEQPRPTTTTRPSVDCSPSTVKKEPWQGPGLHIGLEPAEVDQLLGKDGTGPQAAEWKQINDSFKDFQESEAVVHPFQTSVEVSYGDTKSKQTAADESDQLTQLASEQLQLPAGGGKGPYEGDGGGTLHIEPISPTAAPQSTVVSPNCNV